MGLSRKEVCGGLLLLSWNFLLFWGGVADVTKRYNTNPKPEQTEPKRTPPPGVD